MSADIDAFKSRSMSNISRNEPENNNNNKLVTNLQSQQKSNFQCCSKPDKSQVEPEGKEKQTKSPSSSSKNTLKKPKLVKQKKSVCDEDADEALDQPTDMKDLIRALPDFKSSLSRYSRKRFIGM